MRTKRSFVFYKRLAKTARSIPRESSPTESGCSKVSLLKSSSREYSRDRIVYDTQHGPNCSVSRGDTINSTIKLVDNLQQADPGSSPRVFYLIAIH